MAPLTTSAIARTFAAIEAAAVAGKRCPMNHPDGPLSKGAITYLYKAKRIRGEIYRCNYRVVTLLDGPHCGKSTAPAPDGWKTYKVVGA